MIADNLPVNTTAHPRVCGENSTSYGTRPAARGSSPRVRGKRFSGARRITLGRLIPACAGKTMHGFVSVAKAGAHPRVCGENCIWIGAPESIEGSSPRVRGKPLNGLHHLSSSRLIPACAGKTFSLCARESVLRAHPRVCGENNRLQNIVNRGQGSSPRVRGKREV